MKTITTPVIVTDTRTISVISHHVNAFVVGDGAGSIKLGGKDV